MTRDESAHPEIDRALKQAFPDDLPEDVEAEMAGQIDRFRERWARRKKEDTLASMRPRRWTTDLVSVSLAVVSVLFIILGLSLRASNPPLSLGSSLASLHWEALFSAKISDIQSMECVVRLDKPGEPSQQFIIQWVSPKETRIRLVRAGEETERTFYPSSPESSVLELITRSHPDEAAAPAALDVELRPVEGLLSSARFRRLLDGRWQPAGTERKDGCDWKSFSVNRASDLSISRIALDTCTSLPVRLEEEFGRGEKIEAFFQWVPRSNPRSHFFPGFGPRAAAETTPS